MKRIKKAFLWFFYLEKRLFKKAGYVVLLAAVPVIAIILSLVASRADGIVTVALYCADPSDRAANEIYQSLISDKGLVGFREASSREEAEELVRLGVVDTSWIIEGDVIEKLRDYASGYNPEGPVFTVFVREDKPMLLLAREKLSEKISPYMMRESMKAALRFDFRNNKLPDDEKLNQYYDEALGKDNILQFSYSGDGRSEAEVSYLVIPVRGMLSVMIVLCGLAAAMYYRRDVSSSVFFPPRGRASFFAEVGYILTGIIPASIVAGISLVAVGAAVSPGREIVSLVLFCLTSAVFCDLLMRLVRSEKLLAVLTPVIVIALIGISPIFFDLGSIKALQVLTPTYHYLMSTYNETHLFSAVIYLLAVSFLCEIVRVIKNALRLSE